MTGSAHQPVLLSVLSFSRNGDLLRRAVNLMRRGGVVAFPADCGYVLAARADDARSLGRLAELTGRSPRHPWTLYAADPDQALSYLDEPSQMLQRVAEVFWPGPLTLLSRCGQGLPEAVHRGLLKVAVHVPSHRLARALLELCRHPVVALQARTPLHPAGMEREALLESFGPGLEALVEGREPPGNLDLSVLDLGGTAPRLVRQGFLGPQELQRVLGCPLILSGDLPAPEHFTRFSPEVHLVVVEGEPDRVARRMKFQLETQGGRNSALLVTPTLAGGLLADLPGLEVLPDPECLEDLTRHLFGRIHHLEAQDSVRMILVQGFPREGPTAELMERLTRMAHQVINTEDPGYDGQGGLRPRTRRR
ncbi:MAG: L-threonylcarbamoyladenylate synthase [Burkholderiales bacterium]|jgi:L-threonylcarbamoyladenylate synthase|nr:L-threonylcarbamoyladenylate synthase [Burkholderiales bacterium]